MLSLVLRFMGLLLIFVMREGALLFRALALPGDHAVVARQWEMSIGFGRGIACCHWVGILTVAFLGVAKPR